jgi:glycosyltransferase involved in cell wall biosynthesis
MKRILYACMQLPWPLDNGGKIVLFSDLFHLSKRFEIEVISFLDTSQADRVDALLAALRQRLPHVYFHSPVVHPILLSDSPMTRARLFAQSVVQQEPYVVRKYRSPDYLHLAGRLAQTRGHHALFIESLAPASVLEALGVRAASLKVIYRAYDLFYETTASYASELRLGPTGVAARLDAVITKRYEERLWSRAHLILNVTRRMGDTMTVKMPALSDRICYFPVTIEPWPCKPAGQGQDLRVLYVGTVHYPPNLLGLQWFVDECWPRVRRALPEARFDIVGRGGDRLRTNDPTIKVHNYVEDLALMYAAASVFVVPLFSGSGIRLKILDAMNHCLPVVSTTVGYAGIEADVGHDLLVADDATGFAGHVCKLLGDALQREALSRAGKELLERNHHPRLADQAMDRVVDLVG